MRSSDFIITRIITDRIGLHSVLLPLLIMTINNKSERNYRGKCLGWPVTSYGGGSVVEMTAYIKLYFPARGNEVHPRHCYLRAKDGHEESQGKHVKG